MLSLGDSSSSLPRPVFSPSNIECFGEHKLPNSTQFHSLKQEQSAYLCY